MKKAFTLAEVLVVLLIAGVITALGISVIKNNNSDRNKVLYKSAFRITEQVVNELVSDLSLYATGELDTTFCANFKAKVNTITETSCATSTVATANNFVTSNGMRWFKMEGDFTTDPKVIQVDVNGAGNLPNTAGTDILSIRVFKSGKISAPTGGLEEQYLTQ